jgi:hypothetical protein
MKIVYSFYSKKNKVFSFLFAEFRVKKNKKYKKQIKQEKLVQKRNKSRIVAYFY